MPRLVSISLVLLEQAFQNSAPAPFVRSFLHVVTGYIVRLSASPSEMRSLDRLRADPHYLPIKPVETRAQHLWMLDFIGTIKDADLRQELVEASSSGRGAFARFRNTLVPRGAEYAEWQRYRRARLRERIDVWLSEQDVVMISNAGDRVSHLHMLEDRVEASRRALEHLALDLGPPRARSVDRPRHVLAVGAGRSIAELFASPLHSR